MKTKNQMIFTREELIRELNVRIDSLEEEASAANKAGQSMAAEMHMRLAAKLTIELEHLKSIGDRDA